jgi:phospholipid/cholesterol/gamma-HCH transport system substrate-binding protein
MMISPNRPRKSVTGLLVIAIIAVILAGCSLNPGDLASSVRSAGDGQSVTVKFANTLNLPEGADVTLNGLRVGSVTEVALRGDHVDVAAKLEHGVRIAAEATASIRQNTVLGDPYLAIRGPETGPALAGGVIPLSRTTAPPPLEDTLAVVANFVNGGSIQNMQDVIRSVNTALPDMAQTKRVAKIAAIDMHSLAVDTRHIDTMITGLDRTSRTVIPQLSRLFSGIGIVLPSIGSVFEGGFWLMPMLTEIDGSIQTVRQGVDAIGENDELLRKFLSNSLFPFMRKPGLDIVSARSPQGEEMIGNMTKVLRILGAIR